jgi:hypothetical protein
VGAAYSGGAAAVRVRTAHAALAERLTGQGDAPAADIAGVLVELAVAPLGFVVVEQHELVVHVTRMPGGCDNLFMPLMSRRGNVVGRVDPYQAPAP